MIAVARLSGVYGADALLTCHQAPIGIKVVEKASASKAPCSGSERQKHIGILLCPAKFHVYIRITSLEIV